ncbi:hypothetical protein GCM10009702_10470 [Propioniferax innocua]
MEPASDAVTGVASVWGAWATGAAEAGSAVMKGSVSAQMAVVIVVAEVMGGGSLSTECDVDGVSASVVVAYSQ